MSPAGRAGSLADAPASLVHSWVGVIMYLPTDVPAVRAAITKGFREYAKLQLAAGRPWGAQEHWAKIEAPADADELAAKRAWLERRYPLAAFRAARRRLDPKNILGSEHLDALLGEEQA